MQLIIKTRSFDKNYLIHSTQYEYESALDLILDLFSNHHFVNKEAELYLYQLLKNSEYNTLDDIPLQQLNAIVEYFLKHRDQYKVDYDEERLSYLLLAAIQAEKIIFTIDNRIIKNLKEKVVLKKESILNFFNIYKLESITFNTI